MHEMLLITFLFRECRSLDGVDVWSCVAGTCGKYLIFWDFFGVIPNLCILPSSKYPDICKITDKKRLNKSIIMVFYASYMVLLLQVKYRIWKLILYNFFRFFSSSLTSVAENFLIMILIKSEFCLVFTLQC